MVTFRFADQLKRAIAWVNAISVKMHHVDFVIHLSHVFTYLNFVVSQDDINV